MRTFLFLSFLLSPVTLPAQALPEIVADLARADSLDDEAVGFDGGKSDTYRRYEALLARAKPAELLELSRHKHPVVRCYAVRALTTTPAAADLAQIALDHRTDTEDVTTRSGCTTAVCKAGDVIIELVRPHLRPAQVLDLGEALVRDRSPLYAREWALRTLTFRDGMLHEIRKLAQGGDAPATIALARFRIGADVEVLLDHLRRPQPFDDNCRFLAAAISKDPRLLPALRAILPAARERLQRDNASRLRFWLDAIAAQGNAAAAELLRDVLEQVPETGSKRADLARTLAEVLQSHSAGVFDTVREQAQGR